MRMIVAADSRWGIGYRGKLLVSIPNDMKFFRKKTIGRVIVVGRRTLESFPGGMPLANRVNIILTLDSNYTKKGTVIVHSVREVLKETAKYRSDDVYCVGGASVYRQLLPYADTAFITRIDHVYHADAYFPNLDNDTEWGIAEVSEEQTYFDLTYHFVTYKRVLS